MPRIRLYRGDRPSRGGLALARALGVLSIRRQGSRYRPRVGDTIINWGCTEGAVIAPGVRVLNRPEAVMRAVCKRASLEALRSEGVPVPEFTTDLTEASKWYEEDGLVIGRRLLRASAGNGIVVCKRNEEGHPGHIPTDFPNMPLWTRYFKGRDEYRIHVANGRVIDRQQKRRRRDENGETDARNEIRNLDNGWVFCRDGVEQIEAADSAACAAVSALGLDWGAVDLKVNAQRTRVGVLEVNTAPGLEGTSLQVYAQAIGEML